MAGAADAADFVEALDAALWKEPLLTGDVVATGIGAIWVTVMDYVVTSQIRGFLLATTVVRTLIADFL